MIAQCDSRLVGGVVRAGAGSPRPPHLRTPWLKPGRYTVDVFVCQMGILDSWEGAAAFEVLPNPYPELAGDEAMQGARPRDFNYEERP